MKYKYKRSLNLRVGDRFYFVIPYNIGGPYKVRNVRGSNGGTLVDYQNEGGTISTAKLEDVVPKPKLLDAIKELQAKMLMKVVEKYSASIVDVCNRMNDR